MAEVIVQQFNPVSQCWNSLYTVPVEKYDPEEKPRLNKYPGGQYRYQLVDDVGNHRTLDAGEIPLLTSEKPDVIIAPEVGDKKPIGILDELVGVDEELEDVTEEGKPKLKPWWERESEKVKL